MRREGGGGREKEKQGEEEKPTLFFILLRRFVGTKNIKVINVWYSFNRSHLTNINSWALFYDA